MCATRADCAVAVKTQAASSVQTPAVNWRTLDLNLLTVFDAIGSERSATKAAAKLNMTQPAVSHALTRLRSALSDELFLRTPRGMEPTPYAERLIGPIRSALDALRTALDRAADFEPSTARRTFVIALDNRAALALAPPLSATITAEAPGVKLDMRPSGTLDIPERLDSGDLDIAVGGLSSPGERFSDRRLFEESFAALVRRGHPAAVDGAISIEALSQFPHLAFSSAREEAAFVDEELLKHGLRRYIAHRAPLLSAPATLVQSDMVAILSERSAREFGTLAPLEALRLPFRTPGLLTAMLWHRRFDNVAAHRWLRSVIFRVARTL
jgi:DNA-binding transcriptional LysR family regulator